MEGSGYSAVSISVSGRGGAVRCLCLRVGVEGVVTVRGLCL